MSLEKLFTDLLIIKNRLLDALDDRAFLIRRTFELLASGYRPKEALEEARERWVEYAVERRCWRLRQSWQQALCLIREIETTWIPRDLEIVERGSAENVAELVSICHKARNIETDDPRFRRAIDFWAETILKAAEARR